MNNFTFRNQNGLQFLVCDPMEKIGFINAFSTRVGGVSPLPAESLSLGNFSQDERENVIENRRRFLEAIGATGRQLVTARQIHSADVRSIRDGQDAMAEPTECDALTANIDTALLAVQTADCLPVLLADRRTGAFAAVHAGWRGTLAGIVARTVERMQLSYDTTPVDLLVALGPAIGACCFEVGPEVIDQFKDRYKYTGQLVSKQKPDGKAHLDLNLANTRQLEDCGVNPENIFDCGLCTVCRNDLFFSYRFERGAQNPVGRLMGVIGQIAKNS